MTTEREGAAYQAPSTTYTRRGVLKGSLAVGAGALALTAFGGHLTVPSAAASAIGSTQAADEMLDRSKLTITNTLAVNLTRHSATAPLHQGTFNGQPAWFVITEASDQGIARDLGVNFAPRLANIPADHPAVQPVNSTNPVLGRDMVTFAGVPNFGLGRELVAGPQGFPPAHAQPGAFGMGQYADLVRLGNVVYNAPIVAVGAGPFDLTTHKDTHDRVLAIDTAKLTVELLIVRAFAFGQEIIYHSFSASDPITAVIERGTFVPAMAKIPLTNTRTVQEGARSSIFGFVNGQTGPTSPPAQGLNHVILDGRNPEEATPQNMALMEALRRGGDSRNVLDTFPTLRDPALARLYSPLWDLQMGRWSDEAVAQGRNTAQTDSNQIRQLAAQGVVTAPDGAPLVTQNIVINCPVIGFIDQPPVAPQAPDPGRTPGAP
jgi:hypothetical protein